MRRGRTSRRRRRRKKSGAYLNLQHFEATQFVCTSSTSRPRRSTSRPRPSYLLSQAHTSHRRLGYTVAGLYLQACTCTCSKLVVCTRLALLYSVLQPQPTGSASKQYRTGAPRTVVLAQGMPSVVCKIYLQGVTLI